MPAQSDLAQAPASASPSTTAPAARSKGPVSWGIRPLDERTGGLRAGGTYLLSGLPGSGRFTALLQFLQTGLAQGTGRVGLLTAAPRDRVFTESGHWGFGIEEGWREGRVAMVSYKPDFQRRLLAAADPSEVLDELGALLGPDLERLAIYPASPLWETRAGNNLASLVTGWLERIPATTVAAVGGDMDALRTPASDWVLDAANGVFQIDRLPSGLHEVTLRRLTPPPREAGPITLEAAEGRGLVAPTGALDRRRASRGDGGGAVAAAVAAPPRQGTGRVLLLELGAKARPELSGWLERAWETHVVHSTRDALEAMEDRPHGLVLVHAGRDQVKDAIRAVQLLGKASGAPVLVASPDQVRAGDRVLALEAGASDFLSAPLSVGELASRAERAMIAGPAPRTEAVDRLPGSGSGRDLPGEIRARLEHPRGALFTLLAFRGLAPEGRSAVRSALAREIRDEDGDLHGELANGTVVAILQGTEVTQADAFLDRLHAGLSTVDSLGQVEALSGTVDGTRIRELLDGKDS